MRFTFMSFLLVGFWILGGCAAVMFPQQMEKFSAGPSTSQTTAPYSPNMKVVPPTPEIPSDQARWSGVWSGWMGADKNSDTKLVVVQIRPEDVIFSYCWGLNSGQSGCQNIRGRFDNGQLTGTMNNGFTVNYRMRTNGEVDLAYRGKILGAQFENWIYGVLAKEDPPRR